MLAVALLLSFFALFSFSAEETLAQTSTDPACTLSLGTWQQIDDVPTPHIEGAVVTLNGRIHTISGFFNGALQVSDVVDVLDGLSGTWLTAVTPFGAAPITASHVQGATDGRYIWLVGGFYGANPGVPSDIVLRYDPLTDTWETSGTGPGAPFPPLPAARASGGLTVIGRNLHYVGGLTFDRHIDQADHWVLDLDNPVAWVAAPDMPDARNHFQSVTVGGKMYAVGGQFGHDLGATDLALMHSYDPAIADPTARWQREPDLLFPRSHMEPGTFVYRDRYIFITGGRSLPGNATLTPVHAFDTVNNAWIDLGDIPVSLIGPTAGVVGDQMYVAAGGTAFNVTNSRTWVATITEDCPPVAAPPPVVPPAPAPVDPAPVVADAAPPPPAQPQINVFDPALSKIGVLVPGQLGVTGEQLEWFVTVSNTGSTAGQNVTVTDVLRDELRVDGVDTPSGTATISGQTVSVFFPEIQPGETITFSIMTTVVSGGAVVDNTVCVTAANLAQETCTTGSSISSLPATGESQRTQQGPLGILGLLAAALGVTGLIVGVRRRATAV